MARQSWPKSRKWENFEKMSNSPPYSSALESRMGDVVHYFERQPTCLRFLRKSYGYLQKRPMYRGSNLVPQPRTAYSKSSKFHTKSEKILCTTEYAQTCWNHLKREKTCFYETLISIGQVRKIHHYSTAGQLWPFVEGAFSLLHPRFLAVR